MNDGDTVSGKSAKLPVFSGESGKFTLWWRWFQAYADVFEFGDIVKETVNPNLPNAAKDMLDTTNDKLKIQVKKKNTLAMVAFMMVFENEKLMS